METVSKAVRKEIVESVRARYEGSSKLEKGAIWVASRPHSTTVHLKVRRRCHFLSPF